MEHKQTDLIKKSTNYFYGSYEDNWDVNYEKDSHIFQGQNEDYLISLVSQMSKMCLQQGTI